MQTDLFDRFTEPKVQSRSVRKPPSSGSPTSAAAADSMSSEAGRLRARVLAFLIDCGDAGATDAEIEQHFGRPGNTMRPRRWELVNAGLVYDTDETRLTPGRRKATVWRAYIDK